MRFFIISTLLFQLIFTTGNANPVTQLSFEQGTEKIKNDQLLDDQVYHLAYSPHELLESIFKPVQASALSTYEVQLGEQFKNWTLAVEYNNRDKWEITGKNSEEQDFRVKKDETSVILEFEEKHERLAAEEFKFLILFNHLELILHSVVHDEYEYIEVSQTKDQGFSEDLKISIQLPSSMVVEIFSEYLHGHFDKQNNAFALAEYSLRYDLIVKLNNGDMQLSEMYFSLLKAEETLEQFSFTLN